MVVGAGAFGLMLFLGPRTFRTPLWMPILLLCSGLAGFALLEGAADSALAAGNEALWEELDLAGMSGIPVALAGLLHLAAIFPRRVESPFISAGLLAVYALALFSVFLAPTRLIIQNGATGPALAVTSGTLSDYLLYPLYGGLFLSIVWFAYIALKARNPTEQRAARNMAVSVGIPTVLAGLLAVAGITFEDGDEILLLMAMWVAALFVSLARGGIPLPMQASLRRVMESSKDAIVIVDGEQVVVSANPTAVALFGLSTDWAGRPLDKLLAGAYKDPAAWAATRQHIDSSMAGAKPEGRAAVELVGPQGQPLRVSVDSMGHSPLGKRASGASLRFVDIATEKAAQRSAKQAQELQDLVIRVMGHDLKAPIMVIGGYLQLADMSLAQDLDERQRASLRATLQKAGLAASLMNVIMGNARAISRLTMGAQAAVTSEPADLARLVADAAAVLKPLADAKNITLKMEGPEHLSIALVPGFESVITNLLSNAIKFSPNGGAVGIRLEADETHAGIEVWDSGPGIPQDKRDKLYRKFERLGADSGSAEGHGLGLSIAAQIVALCGGTVSIGDKDDGTSGASFTVELPREQPKPGAAAATSPP